MASIWGALAEKGRPARADSGASLARQLLEMLALRAGEGKLAAKDYYALRVYRRGVSFREKRKYMSNKAIPAALIGRWQVVAHDKLLAYSLLSAQDIPTPAVLAICHPLREHHGSISLKTTADVASYLRKDAPYPVIGKPVRGAFSEDVRLLERYEAGSDTVHLATGEAVPVPEFSESCFARTSGYLFQELLRPHREIRQSISDRICTLRVIVMVGRNDTQRFLATWKIAAGRNAVDNYWREGNLIAILDQESGEVQRCMTGLGTELRPVDHHPQTGRPLHGFRIPHYRDAVELALRGSKALVDLPMQAWDIAITDAGPVAIEVNVVGSLFIPQLVNQKGLLDGAFRDFVRSYRRKR